MLTYVRVSQLLGCRHSSVDSSAPTILPPWVHIPSTPSTLFIVKFVLYLCWEKDENKQKEAGFGPFFKKTVTQLQENFCKILKLLDAKKVVKTDSFVPTRRPFDLISFSCKSTSSDFQVNGSHIRVRDRNIHIEIDT